MEGKDASMTDDSFFAGVSRRGLLAVAAGCVGGALGAPSAGRADDDGDALKLIEQLTGKTAARSSRIHLAMPKVFSTGYTVPLSLEIDSAMTETDHVKYIRVLAPKNPLIEVATFHFAPMRSQARVSTRIRLAEPQFVVAVAETNDGALLMAQTWVEVATNGCK